MNDMTETATLPCSGRQIQNALETFVLVHGKQLQPVLYHRWPPENNSPDSSLEGLESKSELLLLACPLDKAAIIPSRDLVLSQ